MQATAGCFFGPDVYFDNLKQGKNQLHKSNTFTEVAFLDCKLERKVSIIFAETHWNIFNLKQILIWTHGEPWWARVWWIIVWTWDEIQDKYSYNFYNWTHESSIDAIHCKFKIKFQLSFRIRQESRVAKCKLKFLVVTKD